MTVLLLSLSCSREDEIPDGVLTKEEMIRALLEIRTIEGQVASLPINNDSAKFLYYLLEKRLFDSLDLDTATWTRSFNYHILKPDSFIDITSVVIDSLKLRSQKLSAASPRQYNAIPK